MNLDDFCRWWAIKKPPPGFVPLVCLVSFGATRNRMTDGLQKVVAKGLQFWQKHNFEPWVVFGEFTHNPIAGLEMSIKLHAFPSAINVGTVESTIEEAEKWRAALPSCFYPSQGVLIITDEMHSRSAYRISNRVWNGWWGKRLWKKITGKLLVPIFVITFPTRDGIDRRSPMTALRDQKLWVRNNVLRELFLMFVPFGYTIMKHLRIHQPIARD